MSDEKLEYWKSVFTAALVAYISTRKSISGIEAATLAAICADHAVIHMNDRIQL